MGRTFKVERDPYDVGEKLYTKKNVIVEPGLTVLVGTNGSGKSTLINHIIKPQLDESGILYLSYNNLTDGHNRARQRALTMNRIEQLIKLTCSSEGEEICHNIAEMAGRIGSFIRKNSSASELWFIFDAIDSGLSIDNIVDIKDQLFNTVFETNPGKDIYIIVSANS